MTRVGDGNTTMALIIRIDVDRPYGKHPLARHLLSRLSSDLYFPGIEGWGYLTELKVILRLLNERTARAYVFFRRCTLPSREILRLLEQGGHEIGLHLENSRSFSSFENERGILEKHVGKKIRAFSKHGSGVSKYGYHHHAPYEPEKYLEWGRQAQMRVFLGNLEDPSIRPLPETGGLLACPAAFWLEPYWRKTEVFTVDWLLSECRAVDMVLLIHPENVLESPELLAQFKEIVTRSETTILQ